jgi:glycosyltransferase involved in cell wall biosynthesis
MLLHPRFWYWFYQEYYCARRSSQAFCVSEWAAKEASMLGAKTPVVLPGAGGFEKDRCNGFSQDGPLSFLFCGRVEDKVKRVPWILEAFRKARKLHPEIVLHIAGSKKINEPGVICHGDLKRDEIKKLLKSVHVQLNASYYEGYSLSLAEGQYQGALATLATPVGGNLMQVKPGENGFFFHNAEELSSLLCLFASDPELVMRLRQNTFDHCEVLSWEQYAERFYSELAF